MLEKLERRLEEAKHGAIFDAARDLCDREELRCIAGRGLQRIFRFRAARPLVREIE
jgi:hypothetical protein